MTTLYAVIGVVAFCAFCVFIVQKGAKKQGEDKQKILQQEAELELRKQMADIDAAPDVDDPLGML